MNKAELIGSVAKKANLSKSDARAAVEAVVSTIQAAMKNGDKVSLVGFGSFSAPTRPARSGRNPQTGEAIQIPARRVPNSRRGGHSGTRSSRDRIRLRVHEKRRRATGHRPGVPQDSCVMIPL